MSDVAQGPGWWIASDGKWYPPESHPSVRAQAPAKAPVKGAVPSRSTGGPANGAAHVGPQFPDLFEAAMKGSSVADIVTVVHHGPDEHRPVPVTTVSTGGYGGSSPATPSGGGSKKTWRKSR